MKDFDEFTEAARKPEDEGVIIDFMDQLELIQDKMNDASREHPETNFNDLLDITDDIKDKTVKTKVKKAIKAYNALNDILEGLEDWAENVETSEED